MTRNEGSNPSSPEFQIPVWILERFRKMSMGPGINLYAFVCIKSMEWILSGGYSFRFYIPYIYFGWLDTAWNPYEGFIYTDENRIGVYIHQFDFEKHFRVLGKII